MSVFNVLVNESTITTISCLSIYNEIKHSFTGTAKESELQKLHCIMLHEKSAFDALPPEF